MKFSDIQDTCHAAAVNTGWWMGVDVEDAFVVPAKLALIHSEVSEALEGYRKSLMDDHLPHRRMIEVELADAVIRILDLSGALNLDIEGAILEKLAYNSLRADHKLENRAKGGGKKF